MFRPQEKKVDSLRTSALYLWPQQDLSGRLPSLLDNTTHTYEGTFWQKPSTLVIIPLFNPQTYLEGTEQQVWLFY